MTDFHKTIIHQELEKWLDNPQETYMNVSNDDSSFMIETKHNQFILVRIDEKQVKTVK